MILSSLRFFSILGAQFEARFTHLASTTIGLLIIKLPFVAIYAAIIVIQGFWIPGCQTIVEEPVIPEQPKRLMALRDGAIFGPSYSVKLSGRNSVIYSYNEDGPSGNPEAKRSVITVTNEQWREFRKDLDQANVWNWEEDYFDPEVQDGTVWRLVVEYSDQSIESGGMNAYPKEGFETFIASVRKLIKGKDF